MLKAIMFDMDGVLIDSEPIYSELNKEFLSLYNVNPPEEELNKTVGQTYTNVLKMFMGWWNKEIDFNEMAKIHLEFSKNYVPDFNKMLLPNAYETIEYLKNKCNLNISVCSSSDYKTIETMVKTCKLNKFVDFIVSGEMFYESKPNPAIYLYAINKTGYYAHECIAVEDSDYGIRAAKKASLPVIVMKDKRFSFKQENGDYYIEDLAEIKDIVQKLLYT